MGNWWKGVNPEKLNQCELDLMRINGISVTDYTIRDVPLDSVPGSQNYIHEVRVKGTREGLPILVMVHGYMSGGMQFCKMMKHLRAYFEIFTVDLLGMGCSGRPTGVEFTDFDQTCDYFTTAINTWTSVAGLG